ncbi:MAG: ArsR family transcriptional regulator [Pseudomonadota bacterium]
MSLSETLSAHRRLTVLRYLSEVSGYQANASILQDVCNGLGVASTRAQIDADLGWLAEIDLITLERGEGYVVATLTERGGEVASGRASIEGVKRPRPGI